jgi:hypothetical protein
VLHEAGSARAVELDAVRYPTTPEVLRAVQQVMATVPVRDTKLVDLYRNKGSADPFLIVCALVEQAAAADMLIRPHWTVVSEDKAVRHEAEEFDIPWMSSSDFARLA